MSLDLQGINHIAIILDGNGTWAKRRGMPRNLGHKKGVKALIDIISYANKIRLKNLTVFAFSTENWNRPKEEVDYLMSLPYMLLEQYKEDFDKDNIKVRVIGEKEQLEQKTIDKIIEVEERTKYNNGLNLVIAFNYGGQSELVNVCKKISKRIMDKEISIEDINKDLIENNLYTNGIPNVDLLIRTSGQYRISNFMLWQISYSELYFVNTLWPDFKPRDLDKAILSYNKRDRRFGAIKK